MDTMIHEFSTKIYNFNKILIFAGRAGFPCVPTRMKMYIYIPKSKLGSLGVYFFTLFSISLLYFKLAFYMEFFICLKNVEISILHFFLFSTQ